MDKELIDWSNVDDTKKISESFSRNSAKSNQQTWQIDSWVQSYQKRIIQLPSLQRCYEWKLDKQQALIESILIGAPIQSMMLVVEPNSTSQYLLDGYQRTQTMYRYKTNQFKTGANLPDEIKHCRNKYWSDLSKEDQEFFEQTELNIIKVISHRRDWNYLFEKINSNQVNLKPAAMWRIATKAKLMTLLDTYANQDAWIMIFGRNDNFRGLHAILKALAFHFFAEKYQHPMGKFITKFCASMIDYKYKEKLLMHRLDQTVQAINHHNGPGKMAFRLVSAKKPPLPSLIDCMLSSGFQLLAKEPDMTIVKLATLLSKIRDELVTQHYDLLTKHTSKTENVKERFKTVQALVDKHYKKIGFSNE